MAKTIQKVIVYHDEVKDLPNNLLFGHVLLFVPIELEKEYETPLFGSEVVTYKPQEQFFEKFQEIRHKYNCKSKLHFSEVSGKKWDSHDFVPYQVIQMTIDALRNKSPSIFQSPLNFKLAVIFYPKNTDWNIYGGGEKKEQKLRHDETLLRILLKGACHYLYNDMDQICITKLISDGQPNFRPFNENRVMWKIIYDDNNNKTPIRDYVSFSNEASILHLNSDHKLHQTSSEEYIFSHFLQVADLLLGSVSRICFTTLEQKPKKQIKVGDECNKKDFLSQPVREMLEKEKRGVGFKNSSHFRSFTISEASFEKGLIRFKKLEIKNCQVNCDLQRTLTFFDN